MSEPGCSREQGCGPIAQGLKAGVEGPYSVLEATTFVLWSRMAVVHRVIDAEVNNLDSTCYIYTRLEGGAQRVLRLKAVYEVVIGSDNGHQRLEVFMSNTAGYHKSSVSITRLGVRQTYHRGERELIHLECADYHVRASVIKSIKFEYYGTLFVCGSYSTAEDSTLLRHGLYGALYITVEGKRIRRSNPDEIFPYEPKVGCFDLEMLSLNPVDPQCEVYMAAYSDGETHTVIYTSKYLSQDVPDTHTTKYLRARNKGDLVLKLSEAIDRSHPDIITGYNVYNADIPLIYFTMKRTMTNWFYSRQGPRPYFHGTKKMVKRYVDSDSGMSLKIPGTHIVDMYPYLEETLSRDDHKSMKLGDISSHFLGIGKDPLSYQDLDRIYHEGSHEEKLQVMGYCLKDAILTKDLYAHFRVWAFQSAMYDICGICPDRLMSKGMVETTYGMCNSKAVSVGAYMDDPSNKIFMPTGGLVIDPKRGYHQGVYCIDIGSMYPNIVIQHNIDSYSHRDLHALEVQRAYPTSYYLTLEEGLDVLLDSKGRFHGFTRERAILPTVLKDLLLERDRVKAGMKSCTDAKVVEALRQKEQALKKSANSGCGAYGEQTPGNPMSNCIINDIITTTGRRILEHSRQYLESQGACVIYGDTDSLFITHEGGVNRLVESLHLTLPERIRFKLEYRSEGFVMGNKKHYMYKRDGAVKIVGYKGDKSSSCRAVQVAFRGLATVLIEEGPEETLQAYEELVRNCYNEESLDVSMFSWKMNYAGKSYSQGSHRQKLVEAMKSRGLELIPGNSMDVTFVMSDVDYRHKYNRDPGIKLPSYRPRRYESIYTLDEIGNRADVLDVQGIFESQCLSVLISMIKAYRASC